MEEIIGIAYVNSVGEISRIDLYNGFSPQDGSTEGEYTVRYINDASGIDFADFLNSHVWDNGWVNVGHRPNGNFFWNGTKWDMDRAQFMALVRNERGLRLYACDWTQMPDNQLTPEQKTNWANYRQALRNFPATITTETTLEELSWPTQP